MNPRSYAHLIFDKSAQNIQMLLGKQGICMQKTETRSMSFTLYKYQLKVIKDLKHKTSNFEGSAENSREYTRINRHKVITSSL
jgi:hypothetical protein